MVTIYSTTDPKQAAMVEMALRDAEVSFQVDNENAWFALPTPAAPIEVKVRREDQQSAIRAIERALHDMGDTSHPRI